MTDLPTLFPPADLDHIRRETGLSKIAEEDAKKDYPNQKATALSKAELDIKGRFEELQERYLADYQRQLDIYFDRITLFNSALDLNTLDTNFRSLLSNLKNQWGVSENYLFSESQSLKGMSQEVKNFRKTNKVQQRLPHYPERGSSVWVWMIFLALAEIPLNFFLMREAGDAAQVLVQSILYGLINVILPVVLLADLFRNVHHVKLFRKLGGLLSIGLYLGFILCVNLLMAHYRGVVLDASVQATLSQEIDQSLLQRFMNSQEIAFTNFTADMFGLKDIWSWFLFVGGCGLSLIGVIKKYGSDDVYPGYGLLKRRYDTSNAHYLEAVHDTIDQLQASRNDAADEINVLQEKLSSDYRKMPALIQQSHGLKGRCQSAIERLNTDFAMLVQEYRRINELNRQGPTPDYFLELPRLAETPVSEYAYPDAEDPSKAIEKLKGYSKELYESFEELSGRIESTRNVLEDKYPFKVLEA